MQVAPSRACSSFLSCTAMVLIGTVDALQSKAMQVGGCHKPEGLWHRVCCMPPIATVSPAALTSGSMLAAMYRPWILSIKVVLDNVLEDSRGGTSGERNALELLLERAVVVAPIHQGCAASVSSFVQAAYKLL